MSQSTAVSEQRPVTSTSLLARHPLAAYFVLAYGLTWLILLPFFLSRGGGIGLIPFTTSADPNNLLFSLFLYIGALGPALAAIIMSAVTNGWTGVKQLLRRMVQVRAGVRWYAAALFLPLAALLLPALLFSGSAFFLRVFSLQGGVGLLLFLLSVVSLMVLGSPLGEEPGWRGFALPRLQQKYGPLKGSLILGPLWGLWHLPLFFTVWGRSYQMIGIPLALVLFILTITGYTIFLTWLFNNTRGSIFLAILSHAAFDSTSAFFLTLSQASAQPAKTTAAAVLAALLFLTIVWVVIALLVIALTKGRLSYKPVVSDEAQASAAH